MNFFITIDSVLRMVKKNCPQAYVEECKYKIKKIQMSTFINTELESDSESDTDDELKSRITIELESDSESDTDDELKSILIMILILTVILILIMILSKNDSHK